MKLAALALLAPLALMPPAPAQAMPESNAMRRCAAFDHHLLWLVEAHGDAQELSPEEIAEAAFRILAARVLCASGRSREALEAYSAIAPADPKSRWFR